MLGFAAHFPPLPYIPLLPLPTASGKQSDAPWKGDTIFLSPITTKSTMSPSYPPFSADHNSRARKCLLTLAQAVPGLLN